MGLISKLTDVATAISNKTGQPASSYTLDTMPTAINSIQTSFPEPTPEEDDWAVRFIDYDGTVISDLTYSQAQAMTSLPELPTHADLGLVATGWTESLEEIKSVSDPDKMMVGAVYAPNINVSDEFPETTNGNITTMEFKPQFGVKTITLAFTQDASEGVKVDWGDGSEAETSTNVDEQVELTHTYDTTEKSITIQMIPDDGCNMTLGYPSTAKNMFGLTASTSTQAAFPMITRLAIGKANLHNYALSWNWNIEKVTISSNVEELGDYFMSYNQACASVIIPDSVVKIGNYFMGDPQTGSYNYIPTGNKFCTSVVIPNSVESIGDYFMVGNYALKSLVIPDSVVSIGKYFFGWNYALNTIVLPGSLQTIGTYFLYYNYALESLTLPSSITSISEYFMYYNYAARSLVVPSSVTTIGQYFLSYNYALETLTLPDTITTIGNYSLTPNYALKSFVVPPLVTTLWYSFFSSNYACTSITLGESVTGFGLNFLTNNHACRTLTIPSSMNGGSTVNPFTGTGVRMVLKFEKRDTMPTYAWFLNSSRIDYLDFTEFESVPTLSSTTFLSGLNANVPLVVPDSLYDDFIVATNWSTYASQIIKKSDWEA